MFTPNRQETVQFKTRPVPLTPTALLAKPASRVPVTTNAAYAPSLVTPEPAGGYGVEEGTCDYCHAPGLDPLAVMKYMTTMIPITTPVFTTTPMAAGKPPGVTGVTSAAGRPGL